MRIAVDLRSLQSGSISGVENYTLNLLEHLLPLDTKNRYTLFYNSFQPIKTDGLLYVNSTVKRTRIPNKLLNAGLRFFDFPSFEKLLGQFDLLFMPNFNHVAVSKNKKLVVTVHDLSFMAEPSFYNLKRRLWHWSLGLQTLFKRADIICAVSEYTKQDLMRYFKIPKHKIKVVYLGIEHKIFHPNLSETTLRNVRNRYGLPGEFILFVNTIEPRKNLVGLIKAFEQMNTNTSLVIAGKLGWKYEESLHKIRNSKKAKSIHYLGYIDEEDKPYIMKLAKALAYPSFYEGFGFQPLEAMALGVPVVSTQLTSLPEAVGEAAFMVNPYNTGDIAKALDQVLTDDKLREALIEKGYKQARKFNWDTTATQMLEIFNSLGN